MWKLEWDELIIVTIFFAIIYYRAVIFWEMKKK